MEAPVHRESVELIQRPARAVYFALSKDGNLLKIGRSWTPRERMRGVRIDTDPGTNAKLLFAVWEDGELNEKALHCQWRHLHVQNEWHRATPELMAYVKSLRPLAIDLRKTETKERRAAICAWKKQARERDVEVMRLWESGEPVLWIASRFGVLPGSIYSVVCRCRRLSR